MKTRILSLGLISLLLACSNVDDDNSNTNNPPANESSTNGNPAELQGNWIQDCQAGAFSGGGLAMLRVVQNNAGIGFSVRNSLSIDQDSITLTTIGYTDAACLSAPMAESTVDLGYTIAAFTPGQDVQAQLNLQSAQIKPLNAGAATLANASQFCGKTNWQAGTGQSVIGTECLKDMPAPGQNFNQVLNYRDGKIYFKLPDQAESAPFVFVNRGP